MTDQFYQEADVIGLQLFFYGGREFTSFPVLADPPPEPQFDSDGKLIGCKYERADNYPDNAYEWSNVFAIEFIHPDRVAQGLSRSDKPKVPSRPCEATTKRGEPCKLTTKKGNYCWRHKDLEDEDSWQPQPFRPPAKVRDFKAELETSAPKPADLPRDIRAALVDLFYGPPRIHTVNGNLDDHVDRISATIGDLAPEARSAAVTVARWLYGWEIEGWAPMNEALTR